MATNGTAPTTGDLLTVASGVARLSYFYGQLLTQRDLEAEQRYHLALRRLMQREAFGTGTVAGLGVEPVGASAPSSVFVQAGLAMDPDGRELLLPNNVCVTIADAQLTANPTAYVLPAGSVPLYPPANIASQLVTYWGVSIGAEDIYNTDTAALFPALAEAGLTEVLPDVPTVPTNFPALAAQLNQLTKPSGFALSPGHLLRDHLFNALIGTTYLGLRYVERGTEPSPAVLDASCCGGDASCFPSRRQEGVVIVAQHHPFPAVRDPYREAKASLSTRFVGEENPPVVSSGGGSNQVDCHMDLCQYLLGAWRGLPPDDTCGPGTLPVVPIGRVYWSRFQRASGLSRILSVDNCARPFAPGVPPVRALYDVLTQCTSTVPIKPRIETLSPENHGQLTSLTVTAQANAPLSNGGTAIAWELNFYPAATPAAPSQWTTTSGPPAGYPGIAVAVAIPTTAPDTIVLTFTLSGGTTALPAGSYLWRVDIDEHIVAATSGAKLDSTPNPPHAVPSGGHPNIAPFEAVFYVQ
jgi:hypothetical protein